MSLPAHLDYYETHDDAPQGERNYWPYVTCQIAGCDWSYDADWSELGDDEYGTDWNALHPAHPPTT